MAEEQHIGVVQAAYEAFGRGDIESMHARLDETITWSTPGPADLPMAGNRRWWRNSARRRRPRSANGAGRRRTRAYFCVYRLAM